ncbi:sugar isomerase domain-containing protein, partial [Pseudothermotoga sp.]|nr:sugar isomerase domain-containing protein [Pseudothermotoga sp.]MDW8140658.1 sugar isomerase domain-containing protein [Pseudothermotoga sp.]
SSAIEKDQLVHVIGPGGHSNMGAEELFYRAGGLVPVNAILDPGTLLAMGARRSTIVERTPGYGVSVLNAYNVKDGVLIIVNAYGINAMCIDVALEAKRRSVPTIGVTSREFASKVPADHPARHPTKFNLCDVVDVHIDNHMPYGDAVIEVGEIGKKIGPVSTLLNLFVLNLLVIRTVEILVSKGIEAPIWTSANVPGGDKANQMYFEKYSGRIKLL